MKVSSDSECVMSGVDWKSSDGLVPPGRILLFNAPGESRESGVFTD